MPKLDAVRDTTLNDARPLTAQVSNQSILTVAYESTR